MIVWPATQFIQDVSHLEDILAQMDAEKELRVKEFTEQKMLVEAERIKKENQLEKEQFKRVALSAARNSVSGSVYGLSFD